MSRIKVMLRGALISEIELNQEKEYVGGRKDGCDIRLQAEKGISREHFKLKFTDGHWQISAVSRFGDIFSLGQKIETTDLQHGQSFQIPPYEFLFSDVPDAGLPDVDQIPAASIDENERTVIGAVPQVPYIKMVSSTGEVLEMLRLEVGEVWVAGRDPSCQIIIADQRVSRRQFEIYKVNSAYTILDLGSVNGTFVNGSPVSSTDPQTLKSGDSITVLDNMMYFELHDPNFKFKVERIEVPPLPMEEVEGESEPAEIYEQEVPEIEEYDVQQQLMTTDSPFTEMPGEMSGEMHGYESRDQNQYYEFQPPPPSQEAPASGINKIMKNKPMAIGIVIIILAGAYYFSEMLSTPEVAPVAISDDPFSKLTPEQQKEVVEYYKIAELMYGQQKYDLAIEKINKLETIIPRYKDSAQIKTDAENANLNYLVDKRDEEARKAKIELIAANKEIISKCSKLLGPLVAEEAVVSCLTPVLANPGDEEISIQTDQLIASAKKIEKEREVKELKAKEYESKLKEMDKLFANAEDIQNQGYAFKAIKKYSAVIQSSLPDPKKLKEKSQERIDFIKQKIKEKSEISMDTAENLYKSGKIKEAVRVLREAKVYDSGNKNIQNKIDAYTYELKSKMRHIYQESIIDENYGIVENTETKEGAKEKWKKITELDLEDGEYFRKAVIKLHRYGEM